MTQDALTWLNATPGRTVYKIDTSYHKLPPLDQWRVGQLHVNLRFE